MSEPPIEDSGVMRICLDTADLKQVLTIRRQYQLDFDDAYQYVAAAKHGYILVSFDGDFDRTERGRKTPDQVSTTDFTDYTDDADGETSPSKT